MDGERFDQIARAWASGSRRRLFGGATGALLAAVPWWVGADQKKGHRPKNRRQDRRAKHDARAGDGQKTSQGVSSEGCGGEGVACASDAACCAGLCQRNGACTRKKKHGKKKRTVLTGACRCAAPSCVPDNAAACVGKQCGDASNNCGAIVSCGSCDTGKTCQGGACVSHCVPNCTAKQCGSDGCGGSCGSCSGSQICQDGTCCAPNCTSKSCGNDGCGGSCGTCSDGAACVAGMCLAPPTQPTGVHANPVDSSRIRVTWDDVSGEDGYRIDDGTAQVGTVAASTTSFVVEELPPDSSWCFRVQAFNAAGNSPKSLWGCTSTAPECLRDDQCPSGQKCQNRRCVACVPDNAAACAGKQCGNATNNCGTTISCGSCASGKTCQNGTCVSTCVPNCTGKTCGSDGCTGSCGTCSAGQTCQNGACLAPPAQPAGVQAVALDTTRIRLTWNDLSGETGYRIHNGDNLVATVSANTTSYTVTGLAPSTYKCHTIQAFNASGSSAWSDWACTVTQSLCSQHSQCDDGNVCTVGLCEQGICQHRAAACRVRLLVILPSDWMGSTTHQQLGSPSQATILQAARAARDRIKVFYQNNSGRSLRFDDVQVLISSHNTEWFNTPPSGAARSGETVDVIVEEDYTSPPGPAPAQAGSEIGPRAAAEWDPKLQGTKTSIYLSEAGLGGLWCAPGWITLAILGSTWRGGYAGGGTCGPVIKQLPNTAPGVGPHTAGGALVGQWVLDAVISGRNSISCEQRQGGDPAGGPGAWQCLVNTSWGTLMHELGHALSLNHPWADASDQNGWWERHNWNLPATERNRMIMQNHPGYPDVGFHPLELPILAEQPALQAGTALFDAQRSANAPAERGERTPRPDKRRRASKKQRGKDRAAHAQHQGNKGGHRGRDREPNR